MQKLLFWVAVLICNVVFCSAECEHPYEEAKVGDKQIRLYLKEEDWTTAANICGKEGGCLLNIEDAEENLAIYNHLRNRIWGDKTNTKSYTYIWIGGNDLDHEGQFVWKPSDKNMTYTNWSNDIWQQPDNYRDDEHCLELYVMDTTNVFWNDGPCWEKKRFICEFIPQVPL